MKLHFKDQTFSFELLRAVSYAPYGGAEIGECLAVAARIRDGDFESWHVEWRLAAQRLNALAAQAIRDEHVVSARDAFLRASNYYRTAEFFLAPEDPRRLVTYEQSRAAFWNAIALLDTPVELVRLPYEGVTLPAYFYQVDGSGISRPTLLILGGFNSTCEELYFFAVAAALRRGYNCLAFEGPGQGESLRLKHMPARPDYEVPVRAAVDYLFERPEVDRARLAIWGTSLGGYYAPRAAAFEPRLQACIAHGVMYDLWDAQVSKQPLLCMLAKHWPTLLNHNLLFDIPAHRDAGLRWASMNGMWVFGASTRAELLAAIRRYSLKQVAGSIRCPTLVLHGERDHFVPTQQAISFYEALNCRKTLRVFNANDGAEEHCQLGNLSHLHQVAFDWLDEVFNVAEWPDSQLLDTLTAYTPEFGEVLQV